MTRLLLALSLPLTLIGCDPPPTAQEVEAEFRFNRNAPSDRACFDMLGRLGRCPLACNHFNIDEFGKLYFAGGSDFCRYACVAVEPLYDPEEGPISPGWPVSCGHYCDPADHCWLAHMDSDLVIYPGEPVPAVLVPFFEDGDPYSSVHMAVGDYSFQ